MKKFVAVTLALVLLFSPCFAPAALASEVSAADRAYLHEIMQETWHYIDFFISPKTGLPYDNNREKDMTNTTNVGLYLASLCMAYKLGYVTEQHAVSRITQILDSLDTYQHWGRLYTNWLDPDGDDRTAKPGDSNISDYNKLPAGIITVRQTFPQFADRCTAFLNEIPYGAFHEKGTDRIYYAFDVAARQVRYPVYFGRGEDKILGHFLLIASGQVPPSTWDRHNLAEEDRHGYRYYTPGWQGGGLFMQFICGLFLDDRGTPLGKSAVNFAWAQMVHANKLSAPVWGWSACAGPRGKYLGMGGLVDSVVTPHASALAIHLFPHEVIDNLKRLDRMGLREPCMVAGKPERFGYRDAVDWKTGKITQRYLILDQMMLFLSLVNFAEDGLLWKTFAADPMVQHGMTVIRDHADKAQHRAEEEAYIRSLSFDDPGVFWLPDRQDRTYRPGEVVTRELWARSLSSKPQRTASARWRVTDNNGRLIHLAQTAIDLKPRETRNLLTISMPTDRAEYGKPWTLKSHTRGTRDVVADHQEKIHFFSYKDLSGAWRIAKGDHAAWVRPAFKDAGWKEAPVPLRWEDTVFPDYDGTVWYRLRFSVDASDRDRWGSRPLAVAFGAIDDADETYLNGALIGKMGAFPPNEQTAYDEPRLYPFDRKLLRDENVLAVRVSDWKGDGGITQGPIAIGPAGELKDALELLAP